MPVIVLCPSCHEATTHHRAPVTECPRCHHAYSDEVRLSAELALRRAEVPKPPLLLLGQFGASFGGVVFLGLLLLAPFDVGSFFIAGEQMSGPEFLVRAGWVFLLIGGLLAVIGLGLWRERAWARPLMMAYWPMSAVLASVPTWSEGSMTDLTGLLAFTTIAAAVAWWYLYRKDNVVAYFNALNRREAPAPNAA
jgi:hypothetical protein